MIFVLVFIHYFNESHFHKSLLKQIFLKNMQKHVKLNSILEIVKVIKVRVKKQNGVPGEQIVKLCILMKHFIIM